MTCERRETTTSRRASAYHDHSYSSRTSRRAAPLFVLSLLALLRAAEASCSRRVLQSGPTTADVRAEVINLRDALQKIPQYNIAAAMVNTILQPSAPVALLDLLNTTLLLPKTSTFAAAGVNRGHGAMLASLLPNHVVRGRFEFSKQVCGQPLPLVFQAEGWLVNTLQVGGVLQRYAPAENVVYLGPVGVVDPRAQIVHPSIYSGRFFTAQGINAVLFQSPL